MTTLNPAVWVDQYGDYLYAFALARVRDKAVAEDLVQETFLAALSAANSYSGKSTEKTWLTGILKHKIYDYYRRQQSAVGLTSEETDLSGYDYLFERDDEWNGHWNARYAPADWYAKSDNPARAIEESEFQMVLSSCLMGLPERIANAFVMREMDGLTSEQVCSLLMISPNNFWVMMHRARLHLRRCVEVNWFNNPARQ